MTDTNKTLDLDFYCDHPGNHADADGFCLTCARLNAERLSDLAAETPEPVSACEHPDCDYEGFDDWELGRPGFWCCYHVSGPDRVPQEWVIDRD